MKRREFTNQGSVVMALAASAGWVAMPSQAQSATAWNKGAFDSKNLNDVVKAMGGTTATLSSDVVLNAPEIAENGNVVRMGVESKAAGTTQIALLVEKNPNVLSASFDVIAGTDANYSTNVKMGQTSNVYALAKVGDKFIYSVKEVKVTLGGCGG
jgi:sulfur-oxidizing protein SoxY